MNWLFQAAKTGRIKSLAQAIREFFNMNGRMPSVRERNTMGSILQDITQKSNVIEFPKDRITPFYKPRPGDVKKTDESPLSTLLGKQSKELEGIGTDQGMGFYKELGDTMKKHKLEKLELEYDTMYNKILDKAKQIESDPLPLLEAELGRKLTGKETTTELLEIFKNRPKKASGGRAGYATGKEVIEKSILTGPDTAIPPDIKKILDVIGGGAGIATIGLPKWLMSKLMTGGVRSKIAQKYIQLAKENRFRDARQLLTAQDPYIGEDPEMSEAKRTFRKYSRRVPIEEEEELRLSPEMIEFGWRYPGRRSRGVPHEKDFASGGLVDLLKL